LLRNKIIMARCCACLCEYVREDACECVREDTPRPTAVIKKYGAEKTQEKSWGGEQAKT